mmetsp:Transcript_2726/g.9903  ORF Transcript_2726/g.9903 Transcript_2726/m.9903 type:complete len:207 (-) Transcript_2726:2155-2775(-)
MAAHDKLARGAHTQTNDLLHRRRGGVHQLLHELVVGLLVALSDDRHGGSVEHRPSARQPQQGRLLLDGGETVRRAAHLSGRLSVLELAGIRPQQHRQRAVPLGVVARRRVQVGGEHDAIAALVAQDLLLQAAQRGVGVREVGDLVALGEGKLGDVRLRGIQCVLARDQEPHPLQPEVLRSVVRDDRSDSFQLRCLARPKTLRLPRV